MGKPRIPFWDRVEKTETCWRWTGQLNPDGYGVFQEWRKDRPQPRYSVRAHRRAWELTNGPIPPSLCVLHRCDNPACINPDHLWLGTPKDNAVDMATKGRARPSGKSLILTPEPVIEIRRQRAAGLSLSKIALYHSVDKSTIWQVVQGKIWAWV